MAKDQHSAATVVNQDHAPKGLKLLTAPVVLFMEVQSAAHGPKALAARPVATVDRLMNTAAKAAYLALATTQRSQRDPPARSLSIPASGQALIPSSLAFLPASTSFRLGHYPR